LTFFAIYDKNNYARAKSQEPRAKSQEPRAKSQEPRAKSQEPRELYCLVKFCQGVFPLTNKPILAIVAPCYNEQEVLPEAARQLLNKIQSLVSKDYISEKSKAVFVDDGSGDETWALIKKYHSENPQNVTGIKLSKNRGHQNALLCGLLSVKNAVENAALLTGTCLFTGINYLGQRLFVFKHRRSDYEN
jgi:cellulose synthase/poly-beta-1,6-N-acetylglucosamine synthase-like glycosyltransferase